MWAQHDLRDILYFPIRISVLQNKLIIFESNCCRIESRDTIGNEQVYLAQNFQCTKCIQYCPLKQNVDESLCWKKHVNTFYHIFRFN